MVKMTYHFRDRKSLHLNQRKQLTDTNTEVILLLELSNKVFKAVIIKILHREIANMLETNKQYSFNKETEGIKMNHVELLEHKITKIKTQCMCSTIGWKGDRKVNLKTEHRNHQV